MEVPEWGTAPEEDYPSLLAPDNMPASDNARKKAKRKQKQQQEHLQNLVHAPVHLVSTTVLSGQSECVRGICLAKLTYLKHGKAACVIT